MIRNTLLMLGCSALVASAAGWPEGLVSGLVFDEPTHAIRPILGMRGAAILGDAWASGFALAAVAPDGAKALGVREGRAVLLELPGGQPRETDLGPALAGADQIVWQGAAALLVSRSARQAQVFASSAGPVIDLSGLAGKIGSVAAAGSGDRIATAVEGAGIYLLDPDGSSRLIAPARAPGALFVNGPDLFFADGESQFVAVIRDFTGAAATEILIEGVSDVSALFVSASRLLAISGQQLMGWRLDDRTPLLSAREFAFVPSGLQRAGNRLLLANRPGAGEAYFFVDLGNDPAVFFVPAWKGKE